MATKQTAGTPKDPKPGEPPAAFAPTPKMLAFLVALCQAITDGTTLSNRALCQTADISLQTLWDWKHETPGFNDWLADQVRKHAAAPADWEMVKALVYARAKEGSVDHIKLAVDLQRNAHTMLANGLPATPAGTTLIFNIPRPPKELEGKTVVTGAIQVEQS